MKAISMKKPGSSKELVLKDSGIPIPKQGELLVKVETAAVNRTDIVTRENQNFKEPYPIFGVEIAGTVVENQSTFTEFPKGTRVCGLVNRGGYAEYAVLPADRAILIPEHLDFTQAAGVPEVFLTAYQTLYWLGDLQEGQTVLIHAGASGVGTAAIQLAKQLTKATVIVTAGSVDKLAFCEELGADVVINYKTEDFSERVMEVTNQVGVDVILDFIGASYVEKNLKSIKVDGHWVLIGTLGGSVVEEFDLRSLMAKRITLVGTLLTPRSDAYKAKLTHEMMDKTLPYFESGAIKPIIDCVFPLEKAAAAHDYMEANKNIGKIILKVTE